jgi:hypothetical protein
MGRKELGQAFAQRAGSVTVDYAHALAVCQGGFVEKFVDAAGGFLDGGTDYVDFVGRGGFAWARGDGDSRRGRGKPRPYKVEKISCDR